MKQIVSPQHNRRNFLLLCRAWTSESSPWLSLWLESANFSVWNYTIRKLGEQRALYPPTVSHRVCSTLLNGRVSHYPPLRGTRTEDLNVRRGEMEVRFKERFSHGNKVVVGGSWWNHHACSCHCRYLPFNQTLPPILQGRAPIQVGLWLWKMELFWVCLLGVSGVISY